MAENFDAATIKNANRLLELLKARREVHYLDVMREELTENEYKHNFHILTKNLKELDADFAFGAIRGGTGIARDELGLTGEEAQRAIRALKHNLRIQQCGRGRGKCIILLQDSLLSEPDEELAPENLAVADDVAQEEVDVIDANNIPALLRRVRDSYRDREREIRETLREVKTLVSRVEELEAELAQRDEKIAELESKAQIKAVATWQ